MLPQSKGACSAWRDSRSEESSACRSASAILFGLLLVAAAVSCTTAGDTGAEGAPGQALPANDSVKVVAEQFITPFDSADNIDSPAVYHGANGEHWVIATAKSTNVLMVYDAASGALLRRVGGSGSGEGQLSRPNGVLTLDDSLLLVVERDNHRVQGFRLPSFEPIGFFGENLLRLPYGLTAYSDGPGSYVLYVTDNYEMPDGSVPPDRDLGARVKQFAVKSGGAGGRLSARHIKSFGDTAGAGVIRIAESIMADRVHNKLLIAEETEVDSYIKVYDLEGRFTGQVFGRGLFPQQAEGIALFGCSDGTGYWLTTDQGNEVNTFHLFDRVTFAHVASFSGAVTRRTDGIALTQRAFGPFPSGALYGSHLDAAIGALSWAEIARAVGVRPDCAVRQ